MKMSLSKDKAVKKILALLLALMLPAGSVYAADVDKPGENIINEDVPKQEENIINEDVPKQEEASEDEEELKKQTRVIEAEEEVTKVCGEIFVLDVKFAGQTDTGNGEENNEEENNGEENNEEDNNEDNISKADDVKEEAAQNEAADLLEDEAKEPMEDETADLAEGEAAETEEEKQQESKPEDALLYESLNPEIAVIEEGEAGGVQIKTVGIGDTVIKITAPETEQYEKAEAQILLHVIAPDEQDPADIVEEEPPAAKEAESHAAAEDVSMGAMSLLTASRLTSIENVAGGIRLEWKKVKGAAGYHLERSITGKSPWNRVKVSANAEDTSFIDTQVKEGAVYYYRVKAVNESGREGLTSASKRLIRIAAPTLEVSAAVTGIDLKWNRVTGCTGYYVYRREASQNSWTTAATITQPGEIAWRDTSAKNGKTYIYSVRASRGSSLSAYAGEKSYVRVTRPTVKKFKRASATKFKLTWKKNTSATGYQIQYAQNGMFVGAKKATVKSAKKSSYTLSKLPKNKNYYARIRAYKKVNGKTYYSAWSAASNVKKTRTAKAVALSKNDKMFEIRTWAKQKMYQYDTLQGSCTDGTYAYYLLNNRRAVNCKLVKVKRSNLKVVKVSGVLDVAHGNDMTYDKHRKRLVIVHSTGVDPKRLTSVDPNTLTVIESKHVQIPRKLAGGTMADATNATAFSGVAYSSGRRQYAVLLSHNYNFVLLNSNLDPVKYVKVTKKNNYVVQGIDATDDYIMLAQSPKTSKQKYNIITVYDWDGNYISKINVKKGYEIESIYHVGSKYYAGFYRSYYKTSYKNVVKKVVVDGKEKKKKVKVKYKEYLRDNYVYQINGI